MAKLSVYYFKRNFTKFCTVEVGFRNVCVNMAAVYWSRRKNIDFELENKFR